MVEPPDPTYLVRDGGVWMKRAILVPLVLGLVLGCAHTGTVKYADQGQTLTEESAAVFVQDCVKAWSKKDQAVWDRIVDGSFLPNGTLPALLVEEREPSFDPWTTAIPGLTEWISGHSISEVAPGMQLVEGIQIRQMRDLRHLTPEQLRGAPNPDIVIPRIPVQGLTLGLDMDEDGEISSKEKTRVHLHEGVLYWEPFGW